MRLNNYSGTFCSGIGGHFSICNLQDGLKLEGIVAEAYASALGCVMEIVVTFDRSVKAHVIPKKLSQSAL